MNNKQTIIDQVRALAPGFTERAKATEDARQIPAESARELLDSGIARILVPARYGGYALGFDTWFEIAREISKADASHGWCASIITHHAHLVAQFSEQAQQAVWANGPDVAIAASLAPAIEVTPVGGGFRISGQQSTFASGVNHSTWAIIGGFAPHDGPPEWSFFLVPSSDYQICDTWFTAGMRGTGSNTIVTDNVFVPDSHVIKLTDLRDATGPGAPVTESHIFRTQFFHYAPLTFVAPMLGAAQGAYERFLVSAKTRIPTRGSAVVEMPTFQVAMARTAADLDAAELLLLRAVHVPETLETPSPKLLARSVRDFARASELIVSAIDTLIALSGSSGFSESHPIQRAWRDIHFASMHVSLSSDNNYSHFSRMEFGLASDPKQPYF